MRSAATVPCPRTPATDAARSGVRIADGAPPPSVPPGYATPSGLQRRSWRRDQASTVSAAKASEKATLTASWTVVAGAIGPSGAACPIVQRAGAARGSQPAAPARTPTWATMTRPIAVETPPRIERETVATQATGSATSPVSRPRRSWRPIPDQAAASGDRSRAGFPGRGDPRRAACSGRPASLRTRRASRPRSGRGSPGGRRGRPRCRPRTRGRTSRPGQCRSRGARPLR